MTTAPLLSLGREHASDFGYGKSNILDPSQPTNMTTAPPAVKSENSSEMQSPDSDGQRGRRRLRDGEQGDEGSGEEGSSKKRRRSRKGMDKKFECPHVGCGKSYSRAEHLYRHQLNHNPKQIYYCDFPECNRSFVRQDLCTRHKERHTARGSQLLRKDAFIHNPNPIVTAALQAQNSARMQIMPQQSGEQSPYGTPVVQPVRSMTDKSYHAIPSPASQVSNTLTGPSDGSPPLDPTLHSPVAGHMQINGTHRSRSTDSYRMNVEATNGQGSSSQYNSRNIISQSTESLTDNDGFVRPKLQASVVSGQVVDLSAPYNSVSGSAAMYPPQQLVNSQPYVQSSSSYHYQQQQSFTALPPPTYSTMSPTSTPPETSYMASTTSAANQIPQNADAVLLEHMTPTYTLPVFGGEGYSHSPITIADDFAAWLFNDNAFGPSASPMTSVNVMSAGPGSATLGLQAPFFSYDPMVTGYFQQPPPQHPPMSVSALLDTTLPETQLSEDKRRQLIELIEERFHEVNQSPLQRKKSDFLGGDQSDDHHVLSLHMMQAYIASYWVHFHPQLPILHRPTFSADNTPDLMLLSIMALGGSCLEKKHGWELTQECSQLSNFIAWHLRWEIFMDGDFRPPAKLWIFQTLLLLEVFEKMYSTRPLHERAHIHHATTLTLMRRGSSLIGRSALDSPPSVQNGKITGSVVNAGGKNTPDDWWNRWITNEATRRAAFAAFVMDSIHATMFGHSAVMVAHEMRLPLPCDEALWNATNSAEVGRMETNLQSNGIKATTFLDGLKKTLNGQLVRTNSFGRTILMAGLLSVSWHMNQRDLQVSSLGVIQALGGRDKWRGSLTRAFDHWKRDFDESLAKAAASGSASPYDASSFANGKVLDDDDCMSRTVLHHLAHMAMHVDIVDCQIFAGASRLLGRSITPQDYAGAQRRMRETWAPTARARDATFFALMFLKSVLLPHDDDPNHYSMKVNPNDENAGFTYEARDDFLLNRPWVLYFAALIVWSYGFALDGPMTNPYTLSNRIERIHDMQGYLRRVGSVSSPEELQTMKNRNACLGMLVLLRDMFRRTRWELLHEASNLLGKCVELLVPGGGAP